jgi:spermidine synthase
LNNTQTLPARNALNHSASSAEKDSGEDKSLPPGSLWRLILISSAALYLEIVLIRWLGTEVKIFAFFQNLTLLVCFLGFGVGCYTSKKRGSLLPSLVAVTVIVAGVNLPFASLHKFLWIMSSVLSFTPDAALWGTSFNVSTSDYYGLFALAIIVIAILLLLIATAMIPLGRWVGYYLESAPGTVKAYSVNLLGSVIGIWLLAILAFLWLSPPYWFAAAFALILLSQPFSWRTILVACGLFVVVFLALRPANRGMVYWSPYQKLSLTDHGNHEYQIDVNNEGYMSIANLTPEFLAKNPELARSYQDSSYDSPFQFAASTKRVLIVGAGAGNDIAAALRHGAEHVDAVEIDPLIANLGKELHPEQPYSSPRVRFINNDARNFLRKSHDRYDVVLFGLLDSHTEFSGYSNMRVDNYVYTMESFQAARKLLADDGVLIMKFEVRKPWTWLGERFYTMMDGVFSHPPVTYYVGQVGSLFSATVFIESNSPTLWQRAASPPLSGFVQAHPPEFSLSAPDSPPPTTDDWPYVYNHTRSIPRTYFAVAVVVLLLALYMAGPFFKLSETGAANFFLLGAGFLLMEMQMVSRLALYFGTTWIVNCIALTGILSVLLLANLYVVHRRPARLSIFYAALCAALVVNYIIPWNQVRGSGVAVGIAVVFAYCVPFFFAGVIFTESFRRVAGRSSVFGANMLGAVAGGLAQNLSFVFGMKILLIVAAILYAGAALVRVKMPGLQEG